MTARGSDGGVTTAVLLAVGWSQGVIAALLPAFAIDRPGDALDQMAGLAMGGATLFLGCRALVKSGGRVPPPSLAMWIAYVVALLVPSGVVALLAVSMLSTITALRSPRHARPGAISIGLLGLVMLWSGPGVAFAPPFLTLDAIAATGVLDLFDGGATRVGNVIQASGGHEIVIFVGCATAFLVPQALALALALAVADGPAPTRRLLGALATLTLTLTGANVLRLACLAASREAYEMGHGAVGQNAFAALQIALILWAAKIARGGAPATSPATDVGGDPRGRPGRRLAILATLVLVLGGLQKFDRYAAPRVSTTVAGDQAIANFLAAAGWHPARRAPLIADAGHVITEYRKLGCDGAILIAPLDGPGEARATVRRAMGADGAVIAAGVISRWDESGPFDGLVGDILARAGLRHRPMPPFAIAPTPPAEPIVCQAPSASAWSALADLPG